MRIIAGEYRGRRIEMPPDTRPTKDKVRESIFNVLAPSISGRRILDLFAGSGSLGTEALSRGASYAAFVDNSRECVEVIEKNLRVLLGPEDMDRTRVVLKDAIVAIKLLCEEKERFDIIFLDPPYYREWVRKCLKNLSAYDILTPCAFIICEHFKKDDVPSELSPFKLLRQLTYGDTIVSIYKRLY